MNQFPFNKVNYNFLSYCSFGLLWKTPVNTWHFLTVLFGYATTVIPRVYTYYVSTALFAIFGIRMLREGLKMSPDEGQEELEEVQAELKKKDEEVSCHRYMLEALGDRTLWRISVLTSVCMRKLD